MNIKLLNYIGLDLLYNPWYGVPMGLSSSFLRKIQKTSKNPSNIPSLTVLIIDCKFKKITFYSKNCSPGVGMWKVVTFLGPNPGKSFYRGRYKESNYAFLVRYQPPESNTNKINKSNPPRVSFSGHQSILMREKNSCETAPLKLYLLS